MRGNSPESTTFVLPTGVAPTPIIDAKLLLAIAVARWKLILATPLIALLAAYGVLQVLPRVYKSTVDVQVFDPQRQVDQDIQKTMFPFRENNDTTALYTQIEVIKSKSLALRVAEKLGLDQNEEFGSLQTPTLSWLERLGLTTQEASNQGPDRGADRTVRLDRAADAVRQHLSGERLGLSYILTISATSRVPAMAQQLASAAADAFITGQREAREDVLRGVSTWLKSRLEDLQVRIQEEEASIEKLKAASGLGDIAGRGNLTDQQINDLNTQMMTARNDVVEKRARLERARSVVESKGDVQEIPEVRASTTISQLRLQATQLSNHEARLRSELGPKHEAVVATHNQLVAVNGTIGEEAALIVADLKKSYDVAVEREQSLEAKLQTLTAARGDSAEYLKLQSLQRVVANDRKLYETYLSQSSGLSVSGVLQGGSTRIINAAVLPDRPSFPRPLLFYGIFGVFGAGVGCCLAFILEYFRKGFKTSAETVRAFGYPVVGAIPLMRSGKQIRDLKPTALVRAMVDSPLSEFGEAIRATRLSLQLSNSEEIPRTVLVTSSVPGEGKSSLAILLATSSATSGKRTVLVDCDIRRQALSRALGMPPRGLVDLLMGTADVSEVTIRDSATGLYIIPAGVFTANAADLLASQRMRQLIAKLREHYDYVVLDASPVLPVVDALSLAAMVDKVLVVVEWDRTPRNVVFEAFKLLRLESHQTPGIVLNKVNTKWLPGYGYRYGSLAQ